MCIQCRFERLSEEMSTTYKRFANLAAAPPEVAAEAIAAAARARQDAASRIAQFKGNAVRSTRVNWYYYSKTLPTTTPFFFSSFTVFPLSSQETDAERDAHSKASHRQHFAICHLHASVLTTVLNVDT